MFVKQPLAEVHDDLERTLFLSVEDLRQRGSAQAPEPPREAAPEPATLDAPGPTLEPVELAAPAPRSIVRGWGQAVAAASLPRQLTLALLPLLIGLLLLKPVFRAQAPTPKNARPAASGAQRGSAAAPATAPPTIASTAPTPPVRLSPGVTIQRAAADSLAAGDFERALSLYRALAESHPDSAAYRSAVKVLERQRGVSAP